MTMKTDCAGVDDQKQLKKNDEFSALPEEAIRRGSGGSTV